MSQTTETHERRLAVDILPVIYSKQHNFLGTVVNGINNTPISYAHTICSCLPFELLDARRTWIGVECFYVLLNAASNLLRQCIDLFFYLFGEKNTVWH